jgi:hypothetical protein
LIGKVGVRVDCALRPREVVTEEETGRGAYRMCWRIAGSISSANAWLDCRKAESWSARVVNRAAGLDIWKGSLPLSAGGKMQLLEGRTQETLSMSAGMTEVRVEVQSGGIAAVSSNGGAADDQGGLSAGKGS